MAIYYKELEEGNKGSTIVFQPLDEGSFEDFVEKLNEDNIFEDIHKIVTGEVDGVLCYIIPLLSLISDEEFDQNVRDGLEKLGLKIIPKGE